MKKLLIIIPFFLLAFFIFSEPVFAQNLLRDSNCLYDPGNGGKIPTMQCIIPLFANAIYWLIIFSGTIALFLIMFGGFRYLTSGGDPKSVEGARKTITWSIVGLITVLSSFMIVNIVADLTGVNCITRFGFTSCGEEKPCAGNNPTGYCATGKVCVRESFQVYACQWPCNNAHPNGYCRTGTCTFVNTPYGTGNYFCKVKCDNKHHDGYCPYPKKCTRTSVVPELWGCKEQK